MLKLLKYLNPKSDARLKNEIRVNDSLNFLLVSLSKALIIIKAKIATKYKSGSVAETAPEAVRADLALKIKLCP
jgi:hypothetical protein